MDLLMAKAYGGMTQGQLDKLIAERKRKEIAMGLTSASGKPPILKQAKNSKLALINSRMNNS